MSREGHTLTRTMGFEPRQHEILGLDLGDGPPRRAMLWGALCFVVWWALLWLVLGPPTSELSLLWLLPPSLLATYGWREGRTSRRKKVTEWALTARWLRHGHVPVIALGRHEATPSESARFLDRIGHRFGHDEPLALVLPWRAAPGRSLARPSLPAQPGAPIERTVRAQLIGTDTAAKRREALVARTARRRTGRHAKAKK